MLSWEVPKQVSEETQRINGPICALNLTVHASPPTLVEGKTSILRRYFNDSFDPQRRLPTIGADFFSKKIDLDAFIEDSLADGAEANTKDGNLNKSTCNFPKHSFSVVCWDTPGRENVILNSDTKGGRYTAAFSDRFFQNVDAALLVYDVSSSTSFTHVLRWHSELMERIRRMEATGERRRPLPILIVGNKIDLAEAKGEEERPKESVRQRDVLGVAHKNYRGKDYHYEYSASPPAAPSSSKRMISPSSSTNNHGHNIVSNDTLSKPRNRFEISTYMGTSSNVDYLEAILSNEVYRGSYLDSLLSSEDKMGPDRDMVLLWCMRNGLTHMEVSAKTGAGIDELMNNVVCIALAQVEEEKKEAYLPPNQNGLALMNERNSELDLHRRYASSPRRSCFQILPFQHCWKYHEPELS